MPARKASRVTATRKLSEAEAAEARQLRDLAAKDKQEIIWFGRQFLAEKRRSQVVAAGTANLGQKMLAAREAE